MLETLNECESQIIRDMGKEISIFGPNESDDSGQVVQRKCGEREWKRRGGLVRKENLQITGSA